MKKAQKEQAEKIIGLLEHVHDGIKRAVEGGQYNHALELLSQCQESAIELGESIEEMEGEGFVTVALLEAYCEAVYQVYTRIRQVQGVNASKIQKALRKALIPVSNSVKNDIKIRKEAVFLPYKASMWDSLESVWKAAEEDPDCDAYVIPIPYYDKNPDGSFRELHYEGEEYPDYVPITWYEDYDFADRQPDVIFIHNPYDECNYVTSVHPFFYSKNLKQFTEKLVYIPYFILEEPDPENKESVEGMAHFCTLPGVIHADQVIVQSENMRRVYVDVMAEFTAKGGKVNEADNRKYWEKKILGLGSPKVDKIVNTRKEDLEIPEEWMKIIKKPDGSWKKVVLYNTSVTALIQNGEKIFKKMENVFDVFKENQDKAALVWRPHPLIKATIESMRPELKERYEKIESEYCKEGWGIYDDSPDLDRTLEICNLYYGDESSLVKLFQEAGKPVMIQEFWLPPIGYWQKRIKISYEAIIDEENCDLWLVSNYTNILMNYDLNKGSLKGIYDFPEKLLDTYFSVSFVKAGDKIFFAPYNSNHLWSFHIPTKRFEMIDLRLTAYEKKVKQKFRITILHNEKLILIGFGIACIYCIDLKDNQVKRYDSYLEQLKKRGIEKENAILGYDYEIVGDVLYLPMQDHNIIIAFNLKQGNFQLYDIEDCDSNGFCTIDYDYGKFRLINCDGKEFIWTFEFGVESKKTLNLSESGRKNYWRSFSSKGNFIYFPSLDLKIKVRADHENIKDVSFFYPESEYFPDGSKYEFIKKINDTIYFQIRSNGDCYCMDLDTMTVRMLKLEIPPDPVCKQIVQKIFDSVDSEKIYESEIINIEHYMQFAGNRQQKFDRKENYGETIYKSF